MKIKVCNKCFVDKPFSEFHRDSSRKSGFRSTCKGCVSKWNNDYRLKHKEYHKDWYRENKDKAKNSELIRRYGITLKNYNQMFQEQQGCCAICNIHQSELKRALVVDHRHLDGQIRGLLCGKCNHALGNVNDDIGILLLMIEYLNNNKETE